ncbi:MAG: dihydroorotate dehydrogenase-like protein [Rikenellaceae bacterium]
MKNLETIFAGLTLANPIVAASCSLTGTAQSNKMIAEAGVGAIVLKSLFEEDIARETAALADSMMHSEGADYMQAYIASDALNSYINLIKESKALCGETPIIASINCHTSGQWAEYAKAIEAAGADALELNVMTIESSANSEDGELERRHIEIAKSVCGSIQIPVIVKLGAMVSNHVSLVARLAACGVGGFVMFNRSYQTDIDIETMSYTRGTVLSSASDFATPMRYIAITSAALPKVSLAHSGGVQGGECVIKALLAGAATVEVCSTLYRSGGVKEWVDGVKREIEEWQSEKGYESIGEFRGAMCNSDEHSDEVVRAQFLKHFGAYR